MKLIIESCLDAITDCINLMPFLLVTYMLMEGLEKKTEDKQINAMKSSGIYGPFVGGLLGVIPQCGFSLVASNLYSGGVITVGVLLAVFLSTSDEMLPIFLSNSVPTLVIVKILLTKSVIAILTGYAIDYINKAVGKIFCVKSVSHNKHDENTDASENIGKKTDLSYKEHDHTDEKDTDAHHHEHGVHAGKSIHGICENEHCNCEDGIIKSAFKHTFKISVFIVVISFVINIIIALIGEEAIKNVFSSVPILGEAAAALVGLIPNCAASVIITQLYLEGVLNSGAMMAGLLVSAGVGIMVLFRMNRHRVKENIKVLLTLYAVSVIWGVIINIVGITF